MYSYAFEGAMKHKRTGLSRLGQRKLDQLESLLVLIGGSHFHEFSLMGENTQRAILSLAHDLSTAINNNQIP